MASARKEKPETQAVRTTITFLKLLYPDSYVYRSNSGSRGHVRFGFPGLSDLSGFDAQGVVIACEVKTGRGKLTIEQQEYLFEVHRRGGHALLSIDGQVYLYDQIPEERRMQ